MSFGAALATLASYTGTPVTGYAAIWEGWASGVSSSAASGDSSSSDAAVHRPCRSAQRRTSSGFVRLCSGHRTRTAPRVAGGSSLVSGLRCRRGDRVHRGLFRRRVPGFGSSPAGCCSTSPLRGAGSPVPRPGLAPASLIGRSVRSDHQHETRPCHPERSTPAAAARHSRPAIHAGRWRPARAGRDAGTLQLPAGRAICRQTVTEIARARICQEFPGTITSCELRRPAPDSVRSGNVQLGEGRPFETEVCEYRARIGPDPA